MRRFAYYCMLAAIAVAAAAISLVAWRWFILWVVNGPSA